MRIKRNQEDPSYQFYIYEIDTHVLVENHEDGVICRATSRNFSERRKSFFIHHLAAEGYIPDRFQWLNGGDLTGLSGLKWIVDTSWLRLDPKLAQHTSKLMRRALIGAGGLWLAMITFILLHTP